MDSDSCVLCDLKDQRPDENAHSENDDKMGENHQIEVKEGAKEEKEEKEAKERGSDDQDVPPLAIAACTHAEPACDLRVDDQKPLLQPLPQDSTSLDTLASFEKQVDDVLGTTNSIH
jgi:hypothetical protein